jgi:exopolysaccharide biosynthesis polyprenyl glycosylphosphotransferase
MGMGENSWILFQGWVPVDPIAAAGEPEVERVPPEQDPAPRSDARVWARSYARQLAALDAAAISTSLSIALLLRFGGDVGRRVEGAPATPASSYIVVAAALGVAWMAALLLQRTYERQFLGAGAEEYRRLALASAQLWGFVAVCCYVARIDLGRGFVAVAFPLGVALLWLSHWWSRKWLHRLRERRGIWSHRVLVLGDRAHAEHLTARLQRSPGPGYHVVGVCLPASAESHDVLGVPVVGSVSDMKTALHKTGADMVAVTASAGFTSVALRQLSWELEQLHVEMVVSPTLTDVAGPRIHVRLVDGLPLLHITQPEFTGPRRLIKNVFDKTVAMLVLLVLSPMILTVAIAIKFSTPGPILFRQMRIGKTGSQFVCYKFRTMVIDAEARQSRLVDDHGGRAMLFKMADDPRVTPIGRLLRRFSIDELPQLLNVLRGEMSLVGPRPQVQAEVDLYESDYRRRLLVKPGLTGLWQVSGRSDLSFEESVRLDLYYVENWSLTSDLMILWKTLHAVARSRGAY